MLGGGGVSVCLESGQRLCVGGVLRLQQCCGLCDSSEHCPVVLWAWTVSPLLGAQLSLTRARQLPGSSSTSVLAWGHAVTGALCSQLRFWNHSPATH